MSEIPAIGRNPVYFVTFALFVILCLPTALVDNFGGLLVLRFLLGFSGSPCLANGGASMGDMVRLQRLRCHSRNRADKSKVLSDQIALPDVCVGCCNVLWTSFRSPLLGMLLVTEAISGMLIDY
jgi:MFS family permease